MNRWMLYVCSCFSFMSSFLSAAVVELPLRAESTHFQLYCLKEDATAGNLALCVAEEYFSKLTADLRHTPATKMKLKVYPNITSFHEAMGTPQAPNWSVASAQGNLTVSISSPLNLPPEWAPGRKHDTTSLCCCMVASMTCSLLDSKYHKEIPAWLVEGIAMYEFPMRTAYSYTRLNAMANNPKTITNFATFAQLSFANHSWVDFFKKTPNGYDCLYLLVDFIKQKWGWDAVLALCDDYAQFEKILGMTKEEFNRAWVAFIVEKYGSK
jgi:RNA polymerase sigma-70 factor, ECF subfamily